MVGKEIKKINLASQLFGSGEALPDNLTFRLAEDNRLPNGLDLTPKGILSGTPYEPCDENVMVEITADYADPVQFTIDFNIARPEIEINFTSPYVINGVAGSGISQIEFLNDITVNNGATPTFSIPDNGTPSGISFNQNGILSGTPVESADFTTTVTVSSPYALDKTFDLKFNITKPYITINSSNIPSTIGALINTSINTYDFKNENYVTTSNGATPSFEIKTGNLPNGLTFTDGVLSGTPTVVSNETITVEITIPYANPVSFNLTFDINSEIIVNNVPSILSGFTGNEVEYDMNNYVTAAGGVELTFTAENLPSGLSMTSAGILQGTYQKANYAVVNDEYTYTVASNSAVIHVSTADAQDTSFDIPFCIVDKPIITFTDVPSTLSGFVGSQVSLNFNSYASVTNGSNALLTYALSTGQLPINMNLVNGQIIGTPDTPASNVVTFAVKHPFADDEEIDLTINIVKPVIELNPVSATITGTVGTAIEMLDVNNYASINNGGTITWTAPELPQGLEFTDNILSGTPLVSSHETIYLSASSPYADVAQFEVKFNINKPEIILNQYSTTVEGIVGEPITEVNIAQFVERVTDGSQAGFSATGLPNGLSVSEIREVNGNTD